MAPPVSGIVGHKKVVSQRKVALSTHHHLLVATSPHISSRFLAFAVLTIPKLPQKRPQISSLLHKFPQNSEVRGIYENISFVRGQSVREVNLLRP